MFIDIEEVSKEVAERMTHSQKTKRNGRKFGMLK